MRKSTFETKQMLDEATGLYCDVFICEGLLVEKDTAVYRMLMERIPDAGWDWTGAMVANIPVSTSVLVGRQEWAVVVMCDLSAEGRSELIKELGLESLPAEELHFVESHTENSWYGDGYYFEK
jgi:hypothetical protein